MVIRDRYEVLEILGKGSSGIVYKVRESGLGRILAVKEERCVTERQEEAFARELQIMKECFHPSLPVVIDSFRQGDCAYLVMEYVDGVTLQEYIERKGRLSQEQSLVFAIKIGEVMSYLHSRNQPVVYGDLKPENIIVTQERQLRLLDFGTAGREEAFGGDKGCCASPGYAAPEQKKGRQAVLQSDIYALGVVFHYMLTGEDPCKPPYLIRPLRECDRALPACLEKIISRCLKEEVRKRYQNMTMVQTALQSVSKKCGRKWFFSESPFKGMSRYAYRMEKKVWKTQKKGVGLFVSLCLVMAGIKAGFSVKADNLSKVLPITIYDENGYKLCLKEDSVYALKGAFRMEIPKDCFVSGKISEITVILSDSVTQENQIRHFRICPKSSIEN